MIYTDIISIILLSVLLFWTLYNGSIIYVGIRHKRKEEALIKAREAELADSDQLSYSIIVPSKNEESVIQRCLDGILNIDYPLEKIQIIVVDGNSTDKTPQICAEFEQKYPQTFKVISEPAGGQPGKPAALNFAMTYATNDIVAVFDADSLPEQDVLRKTTAYFNSDPNLVALQGKTNSINERSNALTRVISQEEKAWYQMLLSGREKLKLFIPLNGSCQFVKRPVLEQLHGWDENSVTEDVELALRLIEQGHHVKYAPDVCSGQETPTQLNALIKQRTRWYRGYMETALKYGRLMDNINKATLDAEISLAGPFMMVVSLLSYINWFIVVLLSQTNPVINFTGLVIALTAVSLFSIGIALTASEKPIKPKNILWIPSIYLYWMMQMFIAGWAFLKLIFRRKREWSKTAKNGSQGTPVHTRKGI
jgi:cellulose synthase/poly-beta-1,6-N-acetylglucosamine synthase-like glycosyltransferase